MPAAAPTSAHVAPTAAVRMMVGLFIGAPFLVSGGQPSGPLQEGSDGNLRLIYATAERRLRSAYPSMATRCGPRLRLLVRALGRRQASAPAAVPSRVSPRPERGANRLCAIASSSPRRGTRREGLSGREPDARSR